MVVMEGYMVVGHMAIVVTVTVVMVADMDLVRTLLDGNERNY
jgi:hypothetical protein